MNVPKGVALSILILALTLPAASQVPAAASANSHATAALPTIPDGTAVRMRVIRMVSSESDQPGEQVEFEILENVAVGNTVILPQSSSVWGKVTAASPSSSGRSGLLEIRLEGLRLANGQIVPLRNLRQLPVDANADVSPDRLMNLVNSPYGPFQRFAKGADITIPKNTALTLYVAADVPISAQTQPRPLAAENSADEGSGSVAGRITGKGGSTKSLGDIAREQRRRGMVGSSVGNGDAGTGETRNIQ